MWNVLEKQLLAPADELLRAVKGGLQQPWRDDLLNLKYLQLPSKSKPGALSSLLQQAFSWRLLPPADGTETSPPLRNSRPTAQGSTLHSRRMEGESVPFPLPFIVVAMPSTASAEA